MRTLLKIAGLVALVAWVYAPCVSGGWLWDDGLEVAHNTAAQAASGWWTPWVHPVGMDYFPLKDMVIWAEWRLWGAYPPGYHLVTLALHIAAALVLWRLLSELGVRWAYGAALLFAVHPLAVESVAWIAELKNTASEVLVLLCVLAFVRSEATGARAAWVASLGYFVAALLCKTSVVMLPFFLLAYLAWRAGGLPRGKLSVLAPFFGASLVLGLVTVWFQSTRALGAGTAVAPLADRLAHAGASLAAYAGLFAWPLATEPIYPESGLALLGVVGWTALLAVAALFLALRRPWTGPVGLCVAWYALHLVPVMGLIPLSYARVSPLADHFAYLPMLGLVALCALGAGALDASARLRWPVRSAFAVVVGLLALKAHAYAAVFHDEHALWGYAVERNPSAWLAQANLGRCLLEEGHPALASEALGRAAALRPDSAEVLANLGNAQAALGAYDDAERSYGKAIVVDPTFAGAYYDDGLLRLRRRDLAGAERRFRETIERAPGKAAAHNNLGLALAGQGRLDEALACYERAIALEPSLPEAWLNVGNTLVRTGRAGEAVQAYHKALDYNPGYRAAHANLAVALDQLGRSSEARMEREEAARSP